MKPPQNSQQALAELQKTQKTAQNPQQILQAQQNNMGVNQAQESVTGLRGAINNTTNLLKQVAPSIMGRTGSSLVTNAQAVGQIQNAQAPIAQNLTEQGQEYNTATTDLNELQRRASESASGIYQGQQDQQSYLQNLYNTLYGRETAASEAKERERDRQEAIRQFEASMAEQRRTTAGAGSGGFKFDTGGGGESSKPTIQDQAYASVQKFLQGSDDQVRSDFNATLKSANFGNAMDKLKVELYKQSRPDLFSSSSLKVQNPKSSKGLTVRGSGNKGLTFLNSQPLSKGAGGLRVL